MGGAVYGIYYLVMKLMNRNAVAVILSIGIGVIVYGVFLLLLKGLGERELRAFPGGRLLVRVARKLHLIR